ncbi:MAG: hypothetical protein HOB20_03910 [Planctomycetaceae bacterium]|nr:hypothetical protein [Planctomycetaceae bacterium]
MDNETQQIDPRIRGTLQRLRSRIRLYVWIEGLSLATVWLGVMFWLGLAIDYLPVLAGANELSQSVRGGLLVLVGSVLAYILYRFVGQRAFVQFNDRSLALLLERRFDKLQDALVTTVTLKNRRDTEGHDSFSSEMLSETSLLALASIDSINVNEVFNTRLLLKRLALASCLILSIFLLGLNNASMTSLALKRLYMLSPEKWERKTQIELVGITVIRENFSGFTFGIDEQKTFKDSRVKVATGATLRLLVNADGNKDIPGSCVLYYETEDGVSGRRNLNKEGIATNGDQTFVLDDNPLSGITGSLEFEVVGNDHRIGPFFIDVVDSPQIQDVTLDYESPAYTEKLPFTDQPWIAGRTALPFGTNVRINLKSNKPLQQLHISDPLTAQYRAGYLTHQDSRSEKKLKLAVLVSSSTPETEPASLTNDLLSSIIDIDGKQLQLSVENGVLCALDDKGELLTSATVIEVFTKDGTRILASLSTSETQLTFPVNSLYNDLALTVSLYDQDEIISTEPYLVSIGAIADQSPDLDINLEGIGSAITPNAIIPIKGKVTDDYGVSSSWFNLEPQEGDAMKFPVPIENGEELQTPLDLRAQRAADESTELKPESTITLSIQANDKYDLEGDPNIGTSSQFSLDIVTDQQLLAILERQELSLRQRYELILAEVQEMRDSLAQVLESSQGTDDSGTGNEPEDNGEDELSAEQKQKREESLRLLRVQRAVVQSQKSNQESLGVAVSFEDIRLQLINNRVDTQDRKDRLKELIADPLKHVSTVEFPDLDDKLLAYEKSFEINSESIDAAAKSLTQADVILVQMNAILDNMLELETYNELIDLIRDLITDQEEINEKTKDERKKQVLDLLK